MDLSRDGFDEAVVDVAAKSDLAIVAVGGCSRLSGLGEEEEDRQERDESVDFSEVSFFKEKDNEIQ